MHNFSVSIEKAEDVPLPPLPIPNLPPPRQQRLDLVLAPPVLIALAAVEVGHKVAFLVDAVLGPDRVAVEDALRYQG